MKYASCEVKALVVEEMSRSKKRKDQLSVVRDVILIYSDAVIDFSHRKIIILVAYCWKTSYI